MEKLKKYLEGIVIFMIILVLIQTFLEDFAVVLGLGWDFRRILVYSGFVFDLFFTLEFLARYYYALTDGRGGHYIVKERGWIDFLASVPLLAFNSGPAMFALVAGGSAFAGVGGFLNVLKVVKAIRIARVLRLLRITKIFKQIKNTESRMAQRHVAKISTLAITSFVFVVFAYTLIGSFTGVPSPFDQAQERFSGVMQTLSAPGAARPAEVAAYAEIDSCLLILQRGETTIYSRYTNDEYSRIFGPGDYYYDTRGDLKFFFDLREINVLSSRDNLLYFTVVIVLTLMFLFVYSPHFALTVSDPVHVMRRGMTEGGYNLEVKTDGEYREDDIYRLAQAYNEVFLPMKIREKSSSAGDSADLATDLTMDDFKDILGGS